MDQIGALLKRLRESQNLQQQDLSERTGLHISRISRIENDRVEPTKEEIVALMKAIDTNESLAIIEDFERPLLHLTAPSWQELSADDKSAVRKADLALRNLQEFANRKKFPKELNQYVVDLNQRLTTSAQLLINTDYTLNFVGPIGAGKTTAINSMFNLTGEFAKAKRRAKGEFQTKFGLLPTGTGRTTAFEYRVAHGSDVAIRIDSQSEVEILREVRLLCEYWLEKIAVGSNPPRPISEETEKIYRNMARLTETEEEDPVKQLIKPGKTTLDDLFFEVRQRLNLSSRTRSELVFRRDRDGKQTEGEWIQKRCRQLNFGLIPDCPLPTRLTLVLPNPLVQGDGIHFVVVDTRGIDEMALRRDVTDPADDPKAIIILCTRFFDAPTERIRQLIEHFKNKGSEALPGKRVILLVLPYHDEAEKVTLPTGEEAGDKDQGYRIRSAQVQRALGTEASHIKILFFDALSDDPLLRRNELIGQIREARDLERNKIHSLCESVDSLLDNHEKIQFEEAQRLVRGKVSSFLKRKRDIEELPRPTYTRLVKALTGVHSSSLWSITRNAGQGRSINIFDYFGFYVREDSKTRTDAFVHGLTEILTDLRDESSTRRSKRYIDELLENLRLKQTEFLKQTEQIGAATLQMSIEDETELWKLCLSEWGQGSGRYKERVAEIIQDWFDRHPAFSKRLDQRIQEGWDETVTGWLKKYTES